MEISLEAAYEDYRRGLDLPNALLDRASAPLLVKSPPAWCRAKRRVLIIGQETNGWDSFDKSITTLRHFKDRPDGVAVMQAAYEAFALGENYRYRNSAFWRAFRYLTEGGAGLWTNLFRVDVNGPVLLRCPVSEQRLLLEQQRDLLLHEIRLLGPTAIVFVTGPRYDAALTSISHGASFEAVWNNVPSARAARVSIPSVRVPMLRLYHPTYLQRSRQWGLLQKARRWLDECDASLLKIG